MRSAPPARKAVLNRIAAGLGGGYAVAAAAASGLAAALPGPPVEAAVTAQLIAYALFVLVALWSFVPQRGWAVWAGVLALIGVFMMIGATSGRPA
ncbi:iron transporter [Novosphingobium sp. CF614]|uniref:iron transporter n=1 Tax=Novosphingobium sp. CF614 TaxID=1884364 RepID=UPI0015A5EDA5|nr:iron transporter [Novosphingobium sp. CF614]